MTPAVHETVAVVLVKEYLAGLRGYNPMKEAEALLAHTVQSACVSVDHAKAVLGSFDEVCPTPREIKDVALNTRERHLPPKPPPEVEWRKQYGPPDPEWSEKLLAGSGVRDEFWAMSVQAMKDCLYYALPEGQGKLDAIVGRAERAAAKEFWADCLTRNERDHPEEIAALRAGREPAPPHKKKAKPINTEGFDEPILKPITAETIEGVTPTPIQRCATCGGSGRLAGDDYCNDCQTGKDLRRIEA